MLQKTSNRILFHCHTKQQKEIQNLNCRIIFTPPKGWHQADDEEQRRRYFPKKTMEYITQHVDPGDTLSRNSRLLFRGTVSLRAQSDEFPGDSTISLALI
jgi:hypothetical protein